MPRPIPVAALIAALLSPLPVVAQITLGPVNPLFESQNVEANPAVALLLEGKFAQAAGIALPLAEGGSAVAQNLMGVIMTQPEAQSLYDPQNGVIWLMRAAAQGYDKAWHNIGDMMLETHAGLAPNPGLSVAAYQIAVDMGYVASHSELAWMLLFSDEVREAGFADPARGVEILAQGLTLDPAHRAMRNTLADSLYYGAGQPQDLAAALDLYEATAREGDAYGQFSAGYQYYTGEGTEIDDPLALSYFEQAAAQDYAAAYGYAADSHTFGYAGEVDLDKAFFYANRGDQLGDGYSSAQLGYMYLTGTGVAEDVALARAAFDRGWERGNVEAPYQLGEMAYYGVGEPSDYAKAIDIFRQAVGLDPEHPAANYSVAYMMMRGEGTEVDVPGSVPFLDRAIALRDDNAMREAVMLYGADAFAGPQTDKMRAMAHCLYAIDAGLMDPLEADHEVLQTCVALQGALSPEQLTAALALAETL